MSKSLYEPMVPVFQEDGTIQNYELPILPNEAQHLHYYCRHLPTGKVLARNSYFVNRTAFEFCLARWNQFEQWQYAETEGELTNA